MLRKFLVLIISGVLVLTISACSKSAPGSSQNSSTSSFGDPDQPQRTAEVYGKVKSIQGNIVTIAIMTQTQTGQELTEEERAKRRQERQNMSEEERKKLRDSTQTLTGEASVVTVPVGIPIKVRKGPANGDLEEGKLSDIKQGVIVTIWTEGSSKENKASAEYVRVSLN